MKNLDKAYDFLIANGHVDSQILNDLRLELAGRPVYLYGALGRAATLLSKRLLESGVRITAGFDRRGRDLEHPEAELLVKHSEQVIELSSDDVLIVAAGSAQLFESMEEEIRNRTNGRSPQIIDGRKLTYVLQNLHCAALAEHGEYEDLMTCVSYHTKPFKCDYFMRATERLAMNEVPQEIKSEGSGFNSVGYLVSEWCNLRCAQCCEAVPYLESKEMVPVDEILSDLKELTASIKFLHRLDIVGGEPFAHKDIASMIREIRRIPGIGYIAVFTNGTILPSDELCEVLKSDRIIVTNSDYSQSLVEGKKAKIDRTVDKLRSRGVRVIQITDRYWFDLIDFRRNNVGDDELSKNYADCFLESCRRLYKGTLYHCAYQANGIKLGLIPKKDVVEIRADSVADTREQLDDFESKNFIDSCHYCGLPEGATEVVAALQLKKGEIPVIKK